VIYSADDFFDVEAKRYDVCIIGSGPSGISLGLELLHEGLTICTVAGGGLKENGYFRQLKKVESPELEIKDDSRVRAFGGTSTTWSGIIAPLDPIDLTVRDAIHPGWPAEAYVTTAINERGYRYDLPHLSFFDAESLSLERWPKFEHLTKKVFLVQQPPLNFARKYGYAYARDGFDLVLGAAVTSLGNRQEGDARLVTSAILRSPSGRSGSVAARVYVMAAGCIENVRLLLNSKDNEGVALGNAYDQLGRGFMNHPKGYVGEVRFNRSLRPTHPLFNLQRRHFKGYVGFRLEEDVQQAQGLLNSYLRLEPLYPRGLVQALKLPYRMIASSGAVKSARVRCFMDMEASPRNRITLSERRDSLGIPIPVVSYVASERALKSVVVLLDCFARELSALGLGKFTQYPCPLNECLTRDASHHLGGTPMGYDPRTSVVNPELRLHGVDNLYVAGGSAFPSGGIANPTLTMIGLSLRLANTVRASLAQPNHEIGTLPATGHGIIVVGAGRRVAEDVVPAIEALGGSAHVQSIYATRPGVVFGRQRAWDVRPIGELQEGDVASASAIYLAVPRGAVAGVLAALRGYDCRRIRLIVDTPVVSSKVLNADYDRFRSVHVAEDSIALPWLPAVHACIDEMSRIREIQLLNSAYRYHAFALAKAIARKDLGKGGCIKSAYSLRNRARLGLASGPLVLLDEPRDYEIGRLNIRLEDGRVISSHPGADLAVECLREGDRCIGFSVGDNREYLSNVETDLIGRFTASDNIVTRMLDLKRVGLYRLLAAMLSDRANYALADGVEDAAVDRALVTRHLYYRMRSPRHSGDPTSSYRWTDHLGW
jgi:choline dehydrogenase-like flavoprotein